MSRKIVANVKKVGERERWNLEANDLEMAASLFFPALWRPQLCASFNFCPFYCHLCRPGTGLRVISNAEICRDD